MDSGFYVAYAGFAARMQALDVVASNLANASTTGFHYRRLQFQDLIYQNTVAPEAATQQTTLPSGLQVGLSVRPASSEIVQIEGNFDVTGNPLDLAIQGNGFFQVTLPTGDLACTRGGAFHLDQNGNAVDEQGDSLAPNITIPSNASSITVGAELATSITNLEQASIATNAILGATSQILSTLNFLHFRKRLFSRSAAQIGMPTSTMSTDSGYGKMTALPRIQRFGMRVQEV